MNLITAEGITFVLLNQTTPKILKDNPGPWIFWNWLLIVNPGGEPTAEEQDTLTLLRESEVSISSMSWFSLTEDGTVHAAKSSATSLWQTEGCASNPEAEQ